MKIGEIFRTARPYNGDDAVVDGLPNYFYHTKSPNCNLPLLESGINPIQKVKTKENERCPAILISSSPHKIGSNENPWQDFFDPDNGHIHYYGDNKKPDVDPSTPNGNRNLLNQFKYHTSSLREDRLKACPIIVFKRVSVGNRSKGNVQFQGFGIITRVELVTQYDRANNRSFPNYAFDFTIFDLVHEHESFSWKWITKRRNPELSDTECLEYAPKSWNKWVQEGPSSIQRCRRRIIKLLTRNTEEQKPEGKFKKILTDVYEYYNHQKTRFEALAALIAQRVIQKNNCNYIPGWITSAGSDGGADFIGRLDIGSDLARTKLIVLGQAKCEKIDTPTNGQHIARTVARLRRGWIGVYVTTSYFSEGVQREVLEDNYPILLINGLRIAEEIDMAMSENGIKILKDFLDQVDSTYEEQVMNRAPEELLFEN